MRNQTDYIVIHCSATPPSMDVDVKDIECWHKARGFHGVGYHIIIKRNGTSQKGRNINDAGAHVAGYNHKSVGVCLVGGVSSTCAHCGKAGSGAGPWRVYCEVCKATHLGGPENNFTEEQWQQLAIVLWELKQKYPEAKIVGHRELDKGKACPSFDVQAYLKRENIQYAVITQA